jgi:phage I-like protein
VPGVVKTPSDERKWQRAKKLARKSSPHLKGDSFYALVMHIFGRMREAAAVRRLISRFAEGSGTSSYAWTDPKGGKHLPIGDAAHVRNALARFGQTHFTSEGAAKSAWSKIISAAKRFGIKHEGPMPTPKVTAEPASALLTTCPIENCYIHSPRFTQNGAGIAMCTIAIPGDDAPEWIEIIPAGKFSAVDGRGPFENDNPFRTVAASIAKMPQVGLVLDYDHSTDLAAPEGRPAPAAGWIKGFKVEAGAIFARIEWTKAAAEGLKEKLYRYISPVFEHDKDGKVERILRAALTNNPALVSLPAIAAAEVYSTMAEGGKKEELSDIVKRFEAAMPGAEHHQIMKHVLMEMEPDPDGEPDGDEGDGHAEPDGDEHAAQYAAPAPNPGADPYANESADAMAARQADEMARCASDDEKAACTSRHAAEKERFAKRAEMASKPPPQQMTKEPEKKPVAVLPESMKREFLRVPKREKEMTKAEISALVAQDPQMIEAMAEINNLRAERAKDAAIQKVDAGIREGRLIPSLRDWGITLCTTNPDAFKTFIDKAPRIITAGADGKFTGQIGEAPENAVTHQELMVTRKLGVTVEQFAAAKKARSVETYLAGEDQ